MTDVRYSAAIDAADTRKLEWQKRLNTFKNSLEKLPVAQQEKYQQRVEKVSRSIAHYNSWNHFEYSNIIANLDLLDAYLPTIWQSRVSLLHSKIDALPQYKRSVLHTSVRELNKLIKEHGKENSKRDAIEAAFADLDKRLEQQQKPLPPVVITEHEEDDKAQTSCCCFKFFARRPKRSHQDEIEDGLERETIRLLSPVD